MTFKKILLIFFSNEIFIFSNKIVYPNKYYICTRYLVHFSQYELKIVENHTKISGIDIQQSVFVNQKSIKNMMYNDS